jgi:Metallopeptidase toxin 3
MKLLPHDQTAFPRFAKYIKEEFPKLKTNIPIIYGLKKWGKICDTDAARYLSWGQAPMLKLVDTVFAPPSDIADFPITLLVINILSMHLNTEKVYLDQMSKKRCLTGAHS